MIVTPSPRFKRLIQRLSPSMPLKTYHSSSPRRTIRSRLLRSRQAFTLIELLMVMTIIGILTAIAFGITRGVKDSQARAKAKGEMAIIAQALEQFKAKNGDYPWTTSGSPTQAMSNGEFLFQALTGWAQFQRSGGSTTFGAKTVDDVPVGGPQAYVDISKLSYAKSSDLSNDEGPDEYNPEVNLAIPPQGYVFVDPWGQPYVFLHAQNSSRGWQVFGYHLYSKGPDLEDSPAGLDVTTGELGDSYRDQDENLDNIYVGE